MVIVQFILLGAMFFVDPREFLSGRVREGRGYLLYKVRKNGLSRLFIAIFSFNPSYGMFKGRLALHVSQGADRFKQLQMGLVHNGS